MSYPDLPVPLTQRKVRKGLSRSWIVIGVISALLAVLVIWSCGSGIYRNYRIGRSAVDQFHQRLDRADYDSIYTNTTDGFRSAGSRVDQIRFFEAVHQKMGNSGTVTAAGFHVNWQHGHIIVNEVFNTQFAQGLAQEGFIWIIDNGEPRLQTYHIDAPQFR